MKINDIENIPIFFDDKALIELLIIHDRRHTCMTENSPDS